MTPEQRPINYYDILGVAQNATTEEIKAAYRARIAAYHPDRNPSTHATAVAALVNEAWHTLSDPDRRQRYEAAMGFGERARPSQSRQGYGPTPSPEPRAAGGPTVELIFGVFSHRWVAILGAALSVGLLFAASRGFQTRVQQKPPMNAIATPSPRQQTGTIAVGQPQIGERRTASGEAQELAETGSVLVHPNTSSAAQARPTGLPAEIPVVPTQARKDAYDFALALSEGMSAYIDAEEGQEGQATIGTSDVVNALAALRTAQAQWRSAQTLLNRFEASQDRIVAKLAERLARSPTE